MHKRSPEPAGLVWSLSEETNLGWPGPTQTRPSAADEPTSGTGPGLMTDQTQSLFAILILSLIISKRKLLMKTFFD